MPICPRGHFSRFDPKVPHFSRKDPRVITPKDAPSQGAAARGSCTVSPTRGYLLLKWGTLGSNLLKCPYGQMGTKPAKVGHLAANLLKKRRKKTKKQKSTPLGFEPAIESRFWRESEPFRRSATPFSLHIGCFLLTNRLSQKGLCSASRPNLLKWGVPGRGSNLLKCGRPLTSSTPG